MGKISLVRAIAATAVTLIASMAQAQDGCGGQYTVQPGDSLSGIADRIYKDAAMWSSIHANNIASIGVEASNIRAGQRLSLRCINGMPTGVAGVVPTRSAAQSTKEPIRTRAAANEPPRQANMTIRVLAGDGYQPFSDRALRNSGMLSEVVDRALSASGTGETHKFVWINDRSAHLDPMLSEGMSELAFPWIKPTCAGAEACDDLIYSEPMFEMLVMLYTRVGADLPYESEADLADRRVCRPKGLQIEALESAGADWLSGKRATVRQPATAEDCFALLVQGETDFVVLNEFTAGLVLADMGLRDQVEAASARPLAIASLHAVAHRTNPRAQQVISQFDQGLASIKASGDFQRIIDAHLSTIWAGF
ncbi:MULTISPECIES: LysM peptidoglycan-binding domain-containing protein [unclassified Marinovum]